MIILATVIGLGGISCVSYTKSWSVFRVVFPLCYGFVVGFTNMIHLYLVWRYLPGREGLMTGIINAGFSGGASIFTFLSQYLMNPNNIEARKMPKNAGNDIKPYPMSVACNLPKMLRTLCFYWMLIAVFTIVTI